MFQEFVQKLTLINAPTEFQANICEDIYRGVLTVDKKNVAYNKMGKYSCGSQSIVFILESPHKAEFKITPPAPIQGRSGRNFDSCIADFFILYQYKYSQIDNGIYNIHIMNAIQFQTSLGVKTSRFRDSVFLAAWEEFGENDFKKRISKFQDAYLIINSCTVGSKNVKLRDLVGEAVKVSLPEIDMVDAYHFCRWNEYFC